jgi:hypothetical protein
VSGPKLALWWDWRGICEEQVMELRRAGTLANDAAVPTGLDALLRIEVAGVEVDVEQFLYAIECRLRRASLDMAETEVRRILGLALRYRDPEHYLEILVGLYDRLGEPTAKKGLAPVVKLPSGPRDAG